MIDWQSKAAYTLTGTEAAASMLGGYELDLSSPLKKPNSID